MVAALRGHLCEQAKHWGERLEAAVQHTATWERQRQDGEQREAQLRAQVAALEEQLQELQRPSPSAGDEEEEELERLGREEVIETLRTRLMRVEDQLDREREAHEAEAAALRATMASLEARRAQGQRREVEAAETLRTRLSDAESELAREREAHRAEVAGLKAAMARVEAERLRLQRDADAVATLRTRLSDVDEELAREREAHEAEAHRLRAATATLEAEKWQAQQDMETLRTRLGDVEDELAREREAHETETAGLRAATASLGTEQAQVQHEAEALRTRLTSLEEELAREKRLHEAEAAGLRAAMVRLEAERAQVQHEEVDVEEAVRLAEEYRERWEGAQAEGGETMRRLQEAVAEAERLRAELARVQSAADRPGDGDDVAALRERLRSSEEMVAWLQQEMEGIRYRAQGVDVEELSRRLEREEQMVAWLKEECLVSKQEAWRRSGGEAEARRRLREERSRIDGEIQRLRAGVAEEGGAYGNSERVGIGADEGAAEAQEEGEDMEGQGESGGERELQSYLGFGGSPFEDAVDAQDSLEEGACGSQEGEEEDDAMSLWSHGPFRELVEAHRMEKATMLEGFIEELGESVVAVCWARRPACGCVECALVAWVCGADAVCQWWCTETVRVEAQAVIDAERERGIAACRVMMAVQGRMMRRATRLQHEADAWQRWRAAVGAAERKA